eukprot:TRINITY_DN65242_c0_g1_i1.p2 TRINITY_DN65242_c0_g1~~TRINITY_DN65242_c0_g1_i1.p2  ORF type:complete len:170 (-),score=27.44 TRINITY_DN65242_c0_g1_i1:66-575(-)
MQRGLVGSEMCIRDSITEPQNALLQRSLSNSKVILHVDIFEKMKYMLQEKLDRSIWISPIWSNDPYTVNQIKTFFEETVKVGIVVDVRLRSGKKVDNKPKSNIFAIVEFAHPNSVFQALSVASKKQAIICGNRIRIYRAGTQTKEGGKPSKMSHKKQLKFCNPYFDNKF